MVTTALRARPQPRSSYRSRRILHLIAVLASIYHSYVYLRTPARKTATDGANLRTSSRPGPTRAQRHGPSPLVTSQGANDEQPFSGATIACSPSPSAASGLFRDRRPPVRQSAPVQSAEADSRALAGSRPACDRRHPRLGSRHEPQGKGSNKTNPTHAPHTTVVAVCKCYRGGPHLERPEQLIRFTVPQYQRVHAQRMTS